jgi:hypothetical protein
MSISLLWRLVLLIQQVENQDFEGVLHEEHHDEEGPRH